MTELVPNTDGTKEPLILYKASVENPAMKTIAVEHLEECKGCLQQTAYHAMNSLIVLNDAEQLEVLQGMTEILAQMEQREQNMNKIFIEVQDMIEDSKKEQIKVIEEKDDFIKKILDKNIPLAYKIGMVGAFITPYIIMLFS